MPTQEALDAARPRPRTSWPSGRRATRPPSPFGALAEEYSDDPGSNTNGGLYEQVAPGVMFEGFNDWIFADGRAIGRHRSGGESPGRPSRAGTFIYLEGWDEPVWKLTGQERADQ